MNKESPREKSRTRWKIDEIKKLVALREGGSTYLNLSKIYGISSGRARQIYLEAVIRLENERAV